MIPLIEKWSWKMCPYSTPHTPTHPCLWLCCGSNAVICTNICTNISFSYLILFLLPFSWILLFLLLAPGQGCSRAYWLGWVLPHSILFLLVLFFCKSYSLVGLIILLTCFYPCSQPPFPTLTMCDSVNFFIFIFWRTESQIPKTPR